MINVSLLNTAKPLVAPPKPVKQPVVNAVQSRSPQVVKSKSITSGKVIPKSDSNRIPSKVTPKSDSNRIPSKITPKADKNRAPSKAIPKTDRKHAATGASPKTTKKRIVKLRKKNISPKRRYHAKRRLIPMSRNITEKSIEAISNQEGYDSGYREGLLAGEERILEEHIPNDLIIPDITAREAMAAGVQVLRNRGIPLLDAAGVYHELEKALQDKQPYAFIRLGDGELLTMAQEKVLTIEEIKRAGSFLPYAGVHLPNLTARDELASCLRLASLIGVPLSRHPHFQPLLFAVLRAHGIDYQGLRFTTSTMNYALHELGLLLRLLQGRKILVIGDVAVQLSQVLIEQGLEVSGIVTPVNGFSDVHRVVAEASTYDYDIALIAAGVPAIPIAVHLAGIGGKVTFDFGHLANRMAGLVHPERNGMK
ncbi:GT-D fold domain-containing protein [Cohnella abietis]|uniref:GT-D fold-like domain-containing protein n=1 Tax=Cohnella abietis TaxID=2507935 RepID=A0A3T1DA90_9BACL|nr:GT-D fold domain-containing glycosyltransferase [Cohnella abietis]BBI35022.1 hypothetical protein KCTCHS21_44210 [Cohnella abietis]